MSSLITKKNKLFRQAKLTKTDEFSSVFNFRRRLYSEHLVLNFMPNNVSYPRLGMVIAKKTVKSSVERNYIRRVLREFFRLQQSNIGSSDIVINVRKQFTKLNFALIQQEFNQLLNKLTLLNSNEK